MVSSNSKILIIRFSSFGDVTQSLSIPSKLKERFPNSEIHFLTRQDFAILFHQHPCIDKLWLLDRRAGAMGLLRLAWLLKKENFSNIYDAHFSTRSLLISALLSPPLALERLFNAPVVLRKSQKRWKRFLLFRFRKNLYQQPFSGQRDLLESLKNWGIDDTLPKPPQLFIEAKRNAKIQKQLKTLGIKNFIALAPSAAHLLKRWPIGHWKRLIQLNPSLNFICLGGPEDNFINELCEVAPERVFNWAGQLDFGESAAVVSAAQILVSNDTGVLHLAEQLGKNAIALMGPAPFGFPSRKTTTIMELQLSCRPCSKHGQGPCTNSIYQQCLQDISADAVSERLKQKLASC